MSHPPQHGEGDQQENVINLILYDDMIVMIVVVFVASPFGPKSEDGGSSGSFFAPTPTSVHIKGKQYIGDGSSSSASISSSSSNLVDSKP